MFIRLSYLQIMIICETVFTLMTTQGHFASITEAKRPQFSFILRTSQRPCRCRLSLNSTHCTLGFCKWILSRTV